MTEFLLIPKRESEIIAGKPSAIDMSPKNRADNLMELHAWRIQENSTEAMVMGMETVKRDIGVDFERTHTELLSHGIQFLEAEEDAIEPLRSTLPNMHILANREIKFIFPTDTDDDFNLEAETTLQNWHLVSTGIEELRKSDSPVFGSGVTIAVLDTGITPIAALESQVDKHYIYDFQNDGRIRERPSDDLDNRYWHGTAVADLIAGSRNGIAPKSKLVDLAMIPKNSGSLKQFIQSLYFAISLPSVSIINFSAGLDLSKEEDRAIEDVLLDVTDSGILPIAAVGNKGPNNASSPGRLKPVVSVGAANRNRSIWQHSGSKTNTTSVGSFSKPDMVTPGERVYSVTRSGKYKPYDGSSFATAIASGIAALMLEQYPSLNPVQLRGKLEGACIPLDAEAKRQGAGFLEFPKLSNLFT